MNKEIMKSAGFEREVKLVEKGGKCPFCKSYIDVSQFRDKLSRKEFGISGMCQACQDIFFRKEND